MSTLAADRDSEVLSQTCKTIPNMQTIIPIKLINEIGSFLTATASTTVMISLKMLEMLSVRLEVRTIKKYSLNSIKKASTHPNRMRDMLVASNSLSRPCSYPGITSNQMASGASPNSIHG